MTEDFSEVRVKSFRIAWDYLEASGELGAPEAAGHFLMEAIEKMMQKGEGRQLMLSNRAIDAYKRWRVREDLALVS